MMTFRSFLLAILYCSPSMAAEEVTPEIIRKAWEARSGGIQSIDVKWATQRLVPKDAWTKEEKDEAAQRFRRRFNTAEVPSLPVNVVPASDVSLEFQNHWTARESAMTLKTSMTFWDENSKTIQAMPFESGWVSGVSTLSWPKGSVSGGAASAVKRNDLRHSELQTWKLRAVLLAWPCPAQVIDEVLKSDMTVSAIGTDRFLLRAVRGDRTDTMELQRAGTDYLIVSAARTNVSKLMHDIRFTYDPQFRLSEWKETYFQSDGSLRQIDTCKLLSVSFNGESAAPQNVLPAKNSIVSLDQNNKREFVVADGKGAGRHLSLQEIREGAPPPVFELTSDKTRWWLALPVVLVVGYLVYFLLRRRNA